MPNEAEAITLRERVALMRELGVEEYNPTTGAIVLGPPPPSQTVQPPPMTAEEAAQAKRAARIEAAREDVCNKLNLPHPSLLTAKDIERVDSYIAEEVFE